MLAKAEQRRSKKSPLVRGLIALGAGSAVLALPLVAAATANAATPAHQAAKAPAAAPAASSGRHARPATYTVAPGDWLAKIASAHHVHGGWHALYDWNRAAVGDNPSLIHPGLKLSLGPARHAAAAPTSTPSTTGSASDSSASSGSSAPDASAAAGAAAPAAASAPVAATSTKTYTDNLDGWIKHSLDVMAAHGIPGTYNGIYRNIMRESSGNPLAINNWDSNAAAGTPSKGLLQVIQPTFNTYHVPGTSWDIYDPVANITAACNYAAHVYGSIDNVNGPY